MADDFEVVDTESATVDEKKTAKEVDALLDHTGSNVVDKTMISGDTLRNDLVRRAKDQIPTMSRRRWGKTLDNYSKEIVNELKSNLSDEEYFELVENEAKKAVTEELKDIYRLFDGFVVNCVLCLIIVILLLVLTAGNGKPPNVDEVYCRHLDYSWNSTHFHYKYDLEVERDDASSWLLGRDFKVEIYGAKKTRLADNKILYRYENSIIKWGDFTIPKFNVTELYDYHSKTANLLGYKKYFVDIEYTVGCGRLEAERQKWLLARLAASLESQKNMDPGAMNGRYKNNMLGEDLAALLFGIRKI